MDFNMLTLKEYISFENCTCTILGFDKNDPQTFILKDGNPLFIFEGGGSNQFDLIIVIFSLRALIQDFGLNSYCAMSQLVFSRLMKCYEKTFLADNRLSSFKRFCEKKNNGES